MLCASFLSLDWQFVLVNANRKLNSKKNEMLRLKQQISVFAFKYIPRKWLHNTRYENDLQILTVKKD
jgi:hypothetical protein